MKSWVALTMVWSAACGGPTSRENREAVVADYIEAVNRNAVEQALAHHTTDVEFLIPGQEPIVGTTAMRSLLQWDSVLGSRIRFQPDRWSGDTLFMREGAESNAWFRGIGLDSILYAAGTQFVFAGDKIRGIYPSTIRAEYMTEFQGKYGAFFEWVGINAPEASELAPGGQFIYSGNAAERWLDVLSQYAGRG